jgi:hypothetical protein
LLAVAATACALLGSAAADEPEAAHRAIMLPIQVSLSGSGLGGGVSEQDAEAQARQNLRLGLRVALSARAGLDLAELPALAPEEQRILDEHLALIDLIVRPREVNPAGMVIVARSANVTMSRDSQPHFGEGLAFLAERAGTDVAVLVQGFQQPMPPVAQSLGYVGALPYLIDATSSGTSARVALLDLRAGTIRWTDEEHSVNLLGVKRKDLLVPDKVNAMMARLLANYPRSTAKSLFPFISQVPSQRVGPESAHFSAQLPPGWTYSSNFGTVTASRDGILLNSIALVARPHRTVFKWAKRHSGLDVSPPELAESYVENLKSEKPQLRDISVVASETAEVAQRPAFRVRLRYRLPESAGIDVVMQELTVGVANRDVLLLATFRAPQIYYFDAQLPAFDQTVASISFEPPPPLIRH